MKKYIGIDPGKSGVIAIIDEDKKLELIKIPIYKNEIEEIQLLNIFHKHSDSYHCVMEDVHSIFGASAKSNFQFGVSIGQIRTAIKTTSIPLTRVAPKQWQKEMWQGIKPILINTKKKNKKGEIKYKIDTKATSLLAARNLFPGVTFLLTKNSYVPDHNAIDAALMAEYCRRKFK